MKYTLLFRRKQFPIVSHTMKHNEMNHVRFNTVSMLSYIYTNNELKMLFNRFHFILFRYCSYSFALRC